MTHEEKVARWLQPFRSKHRDRDFGVEVGAFKSPVPGIRPFQVDCFEQFGGEPTTADYWGDLCALPFRDHSLDYVVASHVIEHVANPVRALWECARVVHHHGIIYLVVPDRRATFDHTRPLTAPEHMIADFDRGVTDCDPTHLSDYLDGLDWSRWNPAATAAENTAMREKLRGIYLADLAAGRGINIHFHTFEASNFSQLLALMNSHPKRPCRFEVADHAERFPHGREDGLLFVLRVAKPLRDRIAGWKLSRQMAGDPNRTLASGARKFEKPLMLAASKPQVESPPPPPAIPTPAGVRGCLDIPSATDVCDRSCFRVEGWVHDETGPLTEISAWLGDECVGATQRQFVRPDVNAALSLPEAARTGFRIVAHAAKAAAGENQLELRIRRGGEPIPLLRSPIRFGTHDHRDESFGLLLQPTTVGIMRREHMYTTGPSRGDGSAEVLNLLLQYLPPAPAKIADVGCGLGWYGRELRTRHYDWLGLEVKAEDCAELAKQNLPFQQVDGATLPFADGTFDAAIAIEVLEHIEDPRQFLREVHRISPKMLLVSVPNAELLPYLHPYLTTPRHMLDSDHRSFFTRWSLGSLLREYYGHCEVLMHTRHPLTSVDGAPLFYNLFAIAWR